MDKEPLITGAPAIEQPHWPSKRVRNARSLYIDRKNGTVYLVNADLDFVAIGGSGSFNAAQYAGKGTPLTTSLPVSEAVRSGEVETIEDVVNHLYVSAVENDNFDYALGPVGEVFTDELVQNIPLSVTYLNSTSGEEWYPVFEFYNAAGWTLDEYGDVVEIESITFEDAIISMDIDAADTTRLRVVYNTYFGILSQGTQHPIGIVLVGETPPVGGFKPISLYIGPTIHRLPEIRVTPDGLFAIINGSLNSMESGTVHDAQGTEYDLKALSPTLRDYPEQYTDVPKGSKLVDLRTLSAGRASVYVNSRMSTGRTVQHVGHFDVPNVIPTSLGLSLHSHDYNANLGEVVTLKTSEPAGSAVKITCFYQCDDLDLNSVLLAHASMSTITATVEQDGKLTPILTMPELSVLSDVDLGTLRLMVSVTTATGYRQMLTVPSRFQSPLTNVNFFDVSEDIDGNIELLFRVGNATDVLGLEEVGAVEDASVAFTWETTQSGDYLATCNKTYTEANSRLRYYATFLLASGLRYRREFLIPLRKETTSG